MCHKALLALAPALGGSSVELTCGKFHHYHWALGGMQGISGREGHTGPRQGWDWQGLPPLDPNLLVQPCSLTQRCSSARTDLRRPLPLPRGRGQTSSPPKVPPMGGRQFRIELLLFKHMDKMAIIWQLFWISVLWQLGNQDNELHCPQLYENLYNCFCNCIIIRYIVTLFSKYVLLILS